ncbi:EamA family transporter [Kribbella sandramycini]|uniref:Drug/metabolite transporter (DMT)-like permease n=1 Tax=Kribbella sandramycini TaxID=60450 RepID=A0A7Y4NZ30_9ACTN|nr:EamA family transporter [Kribbella sandramycini]MBB6565328.1 drug/metabolite transporter (DMT)-like permease [Kribbella sandramycini]NOL41597.1 EamA family transporter [Kribbella sandramycini]
MTATAAPTTSTGRTASAAMIWTALAIVYVVWGSTYLAIRIVVEAEIPPLLGMAARFLVAGSLLALILGLTSGWSRLRITRREAVGAAVVGLLLLAFGNGAVAIAEQTVPSGLAALLVAATPLWLMALRVGGGERPRLLSWLGVLIGFAGVAVLALSGGGDTTAKPLSIALIVFGTISWATGSRFSPRLGLPKDPLVTALYEMLFGGTAMLLLGVVRGEPGDLHLDRIHTSGWLALLYLVFFGSLLAYSAYSYLLANAPISLIGTYAYVNPAVAVLLGWLILSEPVTWQILAGGAVIICGVALLVTAERRPRTIAAEK